MELIQKAVKDINVINDRTQDQVHVAHYAELKLEFSKEEGAGVATLESVFADTDNGGNTLTLGITVVAEFSCDIPETDDEAFVIYKEAYEILHPYIQEKFNTLFHMVEFPSLEVPKAALSRETFHYVREEEL